MNTKSMHLLTTILELFILENFNIVIYIYFIKHLYIMLILVYIIYVNLSFTYLC
jgi:hypothetical protein